MKVLLTGAFGNVGRSTLDALLAKGCDVRCFDIADSRYYPDNTRTAKKYGAKVELFWGDIIKKDEVCAAVQGVDAILHLAAVIPPLSEKNPSYAELVNIGGTKNVIEAAQGSHKNPRLIFSSSVAVYGDARKKVPPLLRVEDPVDPNPRDEYTKHKIECEKLVRGSGLDWTILRLSFVFSPDNTEIDPLMFEVPLDTLMEPVHTRDAGTALANAAACSGINGLSLNIAGGQRCRTNYREFLGRMMDIFGIGMLPDEAFSDAPFHMGYMDTDMSERHLKYQKCGLEDIFEETRFKKRFLAILGKITRPIGRRFLLAKSPFYKQNRMK